MFNFEDNYFVFQKSLPGVTELATESQQTGFFVFQFTFG